MVSTFICNSYLEKLENEKISWFLFCWISFTIREDVRGVVCVALTTPIFQDLFYIPSELLAIQTSDHMMAFWSSSHTAFWPSRLLTIRPSDHPTTCSSSYLVIQTSDNPDLWPSGLLAIRPSDHPVIQPSGLLAIQSSGHPNFWPSVSMSQKCPYWDIFGLPCGLHQSQIPNVLPVCHIFSHLLKEKTNKLFLSKCFSGAERKEYISTHLAIPTLLEKNVT